jgi:uncharacterized protein
MVKGSTGLSISLRKGKLAFLKPYLPQLNGICKKYGVEKMYALGSIVSGTFDPKKSDIDFLVRFKKNEKVGMELLTMQIELEKLFERKVDLLRERPFANEYFVQSLDETKTLVYATCNVHEIRYPFK